MYFNFFFKFFYAFLCLPKEKNKLHPLLPKTFFIKKLTTSCILTETRIKVKMTHTMAGLAHHSEGFPNILSGLQLLESQT